MMKISANVILWSLQEVNMFKIGYLTIILYLLSCTFFIGGAIYPKYFIPGVALGTLFFIVPSLIIAVMMRIRFKS